MSIIVDQVVKLYGEQKALNNVSLTIGKGEIVGLLGPNGAGKSTLMKIITCFIKKNSGHVSVCELSVDEKPLEIKRLIGYLPEHNPLYPDMYVAEFLTFIARLHKLEHIKQRVQEMIELTGLTPESKKKIGALSKGYRQRVGLAQALIHNPQVLIMDEPTSGLDPNQIVGMRDLIRKLGEEKSVILSTHIMQEVEAMCNRTIIINKGKIVADASTTEMIKATHGGKNIVVEFSDRIEKDKLTQLPGVIHVEKTEQNSWLITTQGEEDVRKNIFKLAVAENIIVLSMSIRQHKLEDIFHELTN